MKEKKIVGNAKGEGIITGGFLIFGADGEPKCMYKEEPGLPLDVERLLSAVKAVRENAKVSTEADL